MTVLSPNVLNVSGVEYRNQIDPRVLGLVRDTHTEKVLRSQYAPAWFQRPTPLSWSADLTSARGFQWYVDKYSEAVTVEPWDDVVQFFGRLGKAAGKPAPIPPLFYPARFPILNTAAMAAAAEALAGWFCEYRYGWQLIIRPPRVTPDLVFLDSSSLQYVNVEVKSSGKVVDVKAKLLTEMIKVLRVLNASKQLRPGPYVAALVMVQVKSAAEVVLSSLVLEEVV